MDTSRAIVCDMTKEKILFISFYAPPMLTIAAKRIGKLIKYFNEFGWETFLLTAAEDSYRYADFKSNEDLTGCAHIKRIKPLFSFQRAIIGNTDDKKTKTNILFLLKTKLRAFIDGYTQYFLNSGSSSVFRITEWEENAVRLINKYNIKYVFVSYSPLFVFKLGIRLKKRFGEKIFLVADYRDLIIGNPSFTPNIFSKIINRQVLSKADLATTVSYGLAKKLSEQMLTFKNSKGRILVLRNGFDRKDHFSYQNELQYFAKSERKAKIILAYTGSFYRGLRDPVSLFKVIKILKEKGKLRPKDLVFVYCGKDFVYLDNLAKRFHIEEFVENKGLVPRNEAIRIQQESDLLVLFSRDNKDEEGILSGKIYEYIASHKPILLLGCGSEELKNIIVSLPNSVCIENNNIPIIEKFILNIVKNGARSDRNEVHPDKILSIYNSYSYENIVKNFIQQLKTLKGQNDNGTS